MVRTPMARLPRDGYFELVIVSLRKNSIAADITVFGLI